MQKLPPLSPRSMKLLDSSYGSTGNVFFNGETAKVMNGTASPNNDSGCYEVYNGVDISGDDKTSTSSTSADQESSASGSSAGDIDFFLKVVEVFREYVDDQIQVLETKHKETEKEFAALQNQLKTTESTSKVDEDKLNDEFIKLISCVHRKQAFLRDDLHKRYTFAGENIRDGIVMCRRRMKVISGVLGYAKHLKSESGETLRENSVRELKQRLCNIPETNSDYYPPNNLPLTLDSSAKFITDLIENMTFDQDIDSKSGKDKPVIKASTSGADITSNSVKFRWHNIHPSPAYHVRWSYSSRGAPTNKSSEYVQDDEFTIHDLPPCCDVTITVKCSAADDTKWSCPAVFTTKTKPVDFKWDGSTAHVKLRLTEDCKSVYYPGNDYAPLEKSPTRFSFALNVLGDFPFHCGKNYFEVGTNGDGWAVGLAYKDVARNSWLGSNESSWILHYNAVKKSYKVRHNGEALDVNPKFEAKQKYLKRVGVYSDFEAGKICFINCKTKEVLYTYTADQGFREPLCAASNPFYHGNALTLVTGLEIPSHLCSL